MRVAIYIRVSTLDQAREGYSLAAQQKSLESWVETHQHEVVCVYADEGISGKDIENRPAMVSMLNDAENHKFDILVVWALSRLTRSVADLYDTWELLNERNIALVSYTEAFDTGTPTGRAMMGLLGVFAQMEREITAERVKAAMAERAAQGKRTTNEVLGYDLVGSDSLKINEEEAKRVRYIFEKYLEYKNLSAVAELCRLKHYTGKRGRVFKAEHIKVILTRPIYAGYNSYCGNIYKGDFEPIIDVKTFNKVQQVVFSKNKNSRAKARLLPIA